MDRVKFNSLASDVAKAFGTDKEVLFLRSKQPHIVHPRQVLWLTAKKNGMRLCLIENFTKENGLDVCHSTIIRGIRKAEELVDSDLRVYDLVEELSS